MSNSPSTPEDVCQHSSCATGQATPGIDTRAEHFCAWLDDWNKTHSYRPDIGDAFDAAFRAAWKLAVSPSPAHAGICETETESTAMNIYEQRLRAVLDVAQRYLPPDGIDASTALGEIIGLVDPWPSPDVGKAQAPSPAEHSGILQLMGDRCPCDRCEADRAAIAQSAPRPDLLEAGKEGK